MREDVLFPKGASGEKRVWYVEASKTWVIREWESEEPTTVTKERLGKKRRYGKHKLNN